MDWSYRANNLSKVELRRLDRICDDFERRLLAGEHPAIEKYMAAEINSDVCDYLFLLLIPLEIECTSDRFTNKQKQKYLQRFPQYEVLIDEMFESKELTHLSNDKQKTLTQKNVDDPILRLSPGQPFKKYQIVSCIGAGSFGVVYHATDTDLDRDVALKVARNRPNNSVASQGKFLVEAQSSAGIKADGIATIYDLFNDEERVCIVQEFIEGCNLKQLLVQRSYSINSAVKLVIEIAEAISLAHQKHVYHRDLKPSNVIVDQTGKPTIVDFGLAWKGGRNPGQKALVGTPNYMSPEQVRGEVNRTDAKTDIWSLGVILYELLTGVRPFDAEENDEIYFNIRTRTPRPLNTIVSNIPDELNRITLKCLSKRKLDRYHNAKQLVNDLQRTLESNGKPANLSHAYVGGTFMPRGLRPFSLEDSDFFLNLLPGPRGYDGIPESVLFWKNRIENPGAFDSFPIGLILGASGSGKSSFVKAGLLPQLSDDIVTVYVEATMEDTGIRLLKSLRQKFPDLPDEISLPAAIALIRDDGILNPGEKLLIVVDQFEQWLNNNRPDNDTQLSNALRHCDGNTIQTILLIREDFWADASRLMDQLEIPIVQNENCRSMELFDVEHAKNILCQYGRAYGKFSSNQLTDAESEFVETVVHELSEVDRIVIVKLALFVEAFRNKDWTLENLGSIGGANGVGVLFLNDTFSSPTVSQRYLGHKSAAQACLNSLLPEAGSDLKGHLQSREQLLSVSGYRNNPARFDELVELLDKDLRLITSTAPVTEGLNENDLKQDLTVDRAEFFQLSHDYLVPILRRWKEGENQRHLGGRINSRMSQATSIWGDVPNKRYLPTWLETVSFLLFSKWKSWTPLQTKMMWASARYHLLATLVGFGLMVGALFWSVNQYQNWVAVQQVEIAKDCILTEIPNHAENWGGIKNRLVPVLVNEFGELSTIQPSTVIERRKNEQQRLNLAMVLSKLNNSNHDDVVRGIETVSMEHVPWLANFLIHERDDFEPDFRKLLSKDPDDRSNLLFRKAIVLAEWGDPSFFIRFAIDMDPEELEEISSVLDKNQDETIGYLKDVVKQLKTKILPRPSASLTAEINYFGGAIGNTGAVVFDIPLKRTDSLLKAAFAEGYWPTTFRPFQKGNEICVAIAWARNQETGDREFDQCIAIRTSVQEKNLIRLYTGMVSNDWDMNDLSILNNVGVATYCCVFTKQEKSVDSKLAIGLSIEQLEKECRANAKSGFQIERLVSIVESEKPPIFTVLWHNDGNNPYRSDSYVQPSLTYPNQEVENPGAAVLADCQMDAIDLSSRYLCDVYREKRELESFLANVLTNPAVPFKRRTADRMGTYIWLLGFVSEYGKARELAQRILKLYPDWEDPKISVANLFALSYDRVAFDNEIRRLQKLDILRSNRELDIPLLKMRFAIRDGDLGAATKIFERMSSEVAEMRIEYANHYEALHKMDLSLIHGKILLAAGLEENSKTQAAMIDEAVRDLLACRNDGFNYLLVDDDFDVARNHSGFVNFLQAKDLGHRVTTSWKFQGARNTELEVGFSKSHLKLISARRLESGFQPVCNSCQFNNSHSELFGRAIWAQSETSQSSEQAIEKRLANAAFMLAKLGQTDLLEEIDNVRFGTGVRQQLPDGYQEFILAPVENHDEIEPID